MTELTPDQKKTVADWIKSGSGLSEVQKRLRDELGVSLTYMDVRLLVLDLGVSVKDKPAPVAPALGAKQPQASPASKQAEPDTWEEEDPADAVPPPGPAGAGRASVSLDRIVKPGALVSGTVTFSDGVGMSWSLDQFGRLGLGGGKPGYKPSQQDIMAFQAELRRLLEQKGY